MRTTIDPTMRGDGLRPRDRPRGYHEMGRAGDGPIGMRDSAGGNPAVVDV